MDCDECVQMKAESSNTCTWLKEPFSCGASSVFLVAQAMSSL